GNGLERESLQRVAGENCRSFVKTHVACRPAASQIVVIHRRKIVVDQRVRMDHLKRARSPDQSLKRRVKGLTDGQQQRGSKTLATSKHAPANRLVNLFRRSCR